MLICCLLAVTPVLLFRAWPYASDNDREWAAVEEHHLLLAKNLAASLERYQQDLNAAFRLLVRQQEAWSKGQQFSEVLTALYIKQICIVDRGTGRVLDGLSLPSFPCPLQVADSVLTRTQPLADPERLTFGSVVAAGDGSNVIPIAVELNSDQLALGAIGTDYIRTLGQGISFGVRGSAVVFDQTGRVLFHPLPDWVTERRSIASETLVQRVLAGEGGVGTFFSPDFQSNVVAAYSTAGPAGWGIVVRQPVGELQTKADTSWRSIVAFLVVGVGSALTLAYLLSVFAGRQVEAITATAAKIADGDFSSPPRPRFPSLLPSELRRLHDVFRRMVLQLRVNRARIHRLAFEDRTTALSNRECFRRRVEAFLGGLRITDKAALLFVDLDGFKAVNDTMGHDAGDDILGQVGARLKEVVGGPVLSAGEPVLKDVTTVPTIARLGGDEFAIFLPQVGAQQALHLAERIRARIELPYPYEQHYLTLGASIGVACVPDDAYLYPELLKAADIAMYEAKRAGKNQVRAFGTSPPVRRERRHEMAEDLFSARISEQFEAHFQPYYRASDLSVTGVEGLLRWLHPKYGLLTPTSFFEMVAELGLQRQIDGFAFERSVGAMIALSKEGIDVGELSLNIPVERLLDERFVNRVASALPLPFQLVFELTETAFPEARVDHARWSVDRLSDAGVRFDLDDFGSARGSLTAMLALAPHRLKLDTRLVDQIGKNDGGAALISSLVHMAHDLGIEVVAKGVETSEQVEVLRSLSVDHLQGFALNRPLAADELAAHLFDPKRAPLTSA